MVVSVWRFGAAAAAAMAVIGVTAACSSETAAASPGASDSPFAQCLTDNGVPAPPEGGPGGLMGGPGGEPPAGLPPGGGPGEGGAPPAPPSIDQATWDSAMQACRSVAPERPSR
jgi:hypothetical protein